MALIGCRARYCGRVVRRYEGRGKAEKAAEWKAKVGLADLPTVVFARP
jgi:hypothetical protein